ncbi:MAG: membrane protein insertion efficiency factor YidD [Candidatus Omnitrophota bacterium]
MKKLILNMIHFYRNHLSILKLQCCRFYPSCSGYAIEAIEKYGVLLGMWKSIKRILKCHPLSKGGYDPA